MRLLKLFKIIGKLTIRVFPDEADQMDDRDRLPSRRSANLLQGRDFPGEIHIRAKKVSKYREKTHKLRITVIASIASTV